MLWIQAFLNAEQLVIGTINIVSAANNALMELDAWRCVQQQQQRGSIERCGETEDASVNAAICVMLHTC